MAPGLPHGGDDLVDLVLEDPQRRGIRDHERRHVRPERLAQRAEVDPAALVRANRDRLVADHRGGRGVRAVGAVRDEHLGALLAVAVGAVVGTRHEHAGQLAVRAGRGLQADGVEAADLLEELGQQPHQLEASLAQRLGVERMRLGQPGQPRGPLVDLRVVLHRARPERIEVQVDRLVQVGEPVEVAEHVELAHLRQPRCLVAQDRCGQRRLPGGALARAIRRRREANGTSSGTRALEDERLDDAQLVATGRAGECRAAPGRVLAIGRLCHAHRVASSAATRRSISPSVVSSVVASSSVSRSAGSVRSSG